MAALAFSIGSTVASVEQTEDGYKVTKLDSAPTGSNPIKIDKVPEYLSARQVHVIDSVLSGKQDNPRRVYEDLLKPLLDILEVKHKYTKTVSASTVAEEAAKIDPTSKHFIILISGDTSLSEFINAAPPKSDVAVLPVIYGTGNAFANSVGLSTILDAVRSLLTGSLHPFPLYRAHFGPEASIIDDTGTEVKKVESMKFFVVGSWCLHATLVADSASREMRIKYGNERFRKAAEKILTENPAFPGSISLETKDETQTLEQSEPLSYFLVSALPRFEATFVISPDSQPSISQLHLLYFRYTDSASTMQIMNEAYDKGAHVKNPLVKYLPVDSESSVRLELDDSIERDDLSRVCIDGTIVLLHGKHRTVTFSCAKPQGLTYLK